MPKRCKWEHSVPSHFISCHPSQTNRHVPVGLRQSGRYLRMQSVCPWFRVGFSTCLMAQYELLIDIPAKAAPRQVLCVDMGSSAGCPQRLSCRRTMAQVHKVEVCIKQTPQVSFAMSLSGCSQPQSAASAGVVASLWRTLRLNLLKVAPQPISLVALHAKQCWSSPQAVKSSNHGASPRS